MNRIDGANPLATSRTAAGQAPLGIESAGHGPDAASPAAPGPQDNVSLSARSRIVAEVAAQVAAAPDARAAKVAQLRAAIGGGSYQVDPAEIARRLASSGSFGDFA
jgi:flagellar biosynthesis anti-sigma factor FlgM